MEMKDVDCATEQLVIVKHKEWYAYRRKGLIRCTEASDVGETVYIYSSI